MNSNGQTLPDTLLPKETAGSAERAGLDKASASFINTFALAVLAGAFIALGAIFSTVATTGAFHSFGMQRLLAGLTFSLGLILVVVTGAELFTGNNLMVMAWAGGKLRNRELIRNWIIVYTGNMAGAFSMVIFIFLSGHHLNGSGTVGVKMVQIAHAKCQIGFLQAVVLGILCNILVCLAVWMCYSTRSVQGRILAIVFPITAFVAAGFEHSVANMYFIPAGIVTERWGGEEIAGLLRAGGYSGGLLTWRAFIGNLLPVTIGNILGGSLFVGFVYWFIYLRKSNEKK